MSSFIFNIFSGSVAQCDAAVPWQTSFQDPATPIMQGIVHFHNDVMVILTFIALFVSYMMTRIYLNFNSDTQQEPEVFIHGTVLEIVWTIVPALILVTIAVPSFALLYSMDECVDPAITLKVVGHQWYWSYEYSDYETEDGESLAFDAYMLPEDELEPGNLRLLEVDNRVVLPADTHIRVIITSADVLHCWAMPSFGIKMDACPGRLNQTSLFINREGVYYGQCSEICGVNHGFMPIAVEAVSLEDYVTYISSKVEEA
jgi:cytochrome c oxidase subunit 2